MPDQPKPADPGNDPSAIASDTANEAAATGDGEGPISTVKTSAEADSPVVSSDVAERATAHARLIAWLDSRTGILGLVHEMLFERIPGGSRWRYVWGSTLIFAFTVQAITGIVLWMHYSPSDTTAWESVQYIQNEMLGGWLLRGIHHFMAQAMVVLLALHMLQVVIDGAYKAPREINFWLGLILMQIVLGLSLTGYLLPWDQKGYWATRVATNLMGLVPGVGEQVQQVVVGGQDYNHHTVTRFFALHAGLLPALLVMFVAAHVAVFRRHGIAAKLPLRGPDQYFWPDQVLKDGIACLAVILTVLGLTLYFRGADLTAPADGAREYSAARPEWYFLFLFQFLKLFEGYGAIGELVGAIVIPGLVVGFMFLMPFIAHLRHGHRINVGAMAFLILGAGTLTFLAVREDRNNQNYQNAKWVALEEAKLAEHKAQQEGIGLSGMRDKLRRDPQAIALQTLSNECFKCHNYESPKHEGYILESPNAPNLYDFGTAEWAKGILDVHQIGGKDYFGTTNLKEGRMAAFLKKANLAPGVIDELAAALGQEAVGVSADRKKEHLALFEKHKCLQCHTYDGQGAEEDERAPRLNGWGSTEWLQGMIANPAGEDFYGHLGNNQGMPAFGQVKGNAQAKNLDPEVIRQMARWLRGEWYQGAAH